MPQVALLGAAHIHAPGFVKKLIDRKDAHVAAVWDHDAARAKKNAEQLGASIVKSVDAILADKKIDAVVVCSETDRHEQLVLKAAAAGKHMFVEKPLGFAGDDARRMADAIERAGVLFQTGYFLRGLPVNQYLKQLIDQGAFGTITRVRHSNCHNGSLGGWFDKEWRWMADPKIAGCGAFGDLATHALDILMWLFGDIVCVAADIKIVTGRYGDCDEAGEAMLKFATGVTGTLAGSWLDIADRAQLMITGTEGHAQVMNGQLYLTCKHIEGADGSKPWTTLPQGWPHAFDLFLDAVGGKQGVPLVTAREAAARSIAMEAMYTAAEQRRWIDVEP